MGCGMRMGQQGGRANVRMHLNTVKLPGRNWDWLLDPLGL